MSCVTFLVVDGIDNTETRGRRATINRGAKWILKGMCGECVVLVLSGRKWRCTQERDHVSHTDLLEYSECKDNAFYLNSSSM